MAATATTIITMAEPPDTRSVRPLFTADDIAGRVAGLAAEIAAAGHRELVVIPVLTGGFVFAADLVRALHAIGVSAEIDFMTLSSYGQGTTSKGTIDVVQDIRTNVAGRDVLIVDDIIETGRTLAFVRDVLAARGARKVMIAALCDKPGKRARAIEPDFIGFVCPDEFVVGYGMDIGQTFRQLPFIGVIDDKE
jgi:hypoxanthine phosphoribosyltransferase